MKNHPFATIACVLSVAWLLSTHAQSQADHPPRDPGQIRELLRNGMGLRNRGKLPEAIEAFQTVKDEASRLDDKTIQAEAMIQAAHAHQELSSGDSPQPDHLEQAIKLYRSAIEIAPPPQRVQAQNNLGMLYLLTKDFSKAVDVLKEIDRVQIRPEERFVYDYNLGRAYDLSGKPTLAYPSYLTALKANPKFTPAAVKAFENLIRSQRPDRMNAALNLAEHLLANAQGELAASEALKCLDAWGDDLASERLLTLLVRCYATASMLPDRFRKAEWPKLDRIGNSHPHLRPVLEEIRVAYLERLEPVIQEPFSGAVRPFLEWSRIGQGEASGKKSFPALLKKIGDFFYQSAGESGQARDPGQALARYSTAWSMDTLNTEAALFTAALLRDYPRQLDSEHVLYRKLVNSLFEVKGALYQQNPQSPADWANLMKMHYLLGSIFEKDRMPGNANDPRGAIFQWNYAIRAEDRLRTLDPTYPPTPGLHQHLATAYELAEEPVKALEQYLSASEEFLELDDTESAKEAVVRLKALKGKGVSWSPDQDRRLAQVLRRFENSVDLPRTALAIGDEMPQVPEIRAVSGNEVVSLDVRNVKADVIVLVFLTSQSSAVAAYEDRMIDFARDYKEKGVKFVAISAGPRESDRLPAMKSHALDKHLPYAVGDDERQEVARRFGATVAPQFFVFSPDRRLAYVGAMDDSPSETKVTKNYLRDAVDSLLQGRSIEVTRTNPIGTTIEYRR